MLLKRKGGGYICEYLDTYVNTLKTLPTGLSIQIAAMFTPN